jgi:hypothetical protein
VARQNFSSLLLYGMTTPSQAAIATFKGSGPYRKVVAKPGFVAIKSTVTLPSFKNDNIVYEKQPNGKNVDAAHVYFGGVSTTLQAIDAGFQHNNGVGDWSPFIRVGGFVGDKGYTFGNRIDGDQEVEMRLEVAAKNHLILTCFIDGAEVDRVEVKPDEDKLKGWDPANPQFVFKRMTSIAMSVPELERPCCCLNVRWKDTMVKRSAGDWTPYRAKDNDSMSGKEQARFYPDRQVVQVTAFEDWGNETVHVRVV